jgi:GntR family transcriptional regulator/MocR family aminotransferase
MSRSWANSSTDLHLDLAGARSRAALEGALRDAVRSGRLPAGTRLPSSRALAGDLGLARNTIAGAYGQLVAEGWLTARQGAGTTVAAAAAVVDELPPRPGPEGDRIRFDLRPGSPDLAAFPRARWLAAARRALADAPAVALGYGDGQGRPELRHALARYLARARGVRATADRIVICTGFAQGLALLCEVLTRRRASTLAVEAYGIPAHRKLAAASGLRVGSVPVDGEGAVVGALEDEDAVLLTPAHQFPLGMPLAADRRLQAAAWARHRGALVIEDDYDGEFRYDRQPLGATQALAPEHVAYAGTASKTLAPGLRLGWLVLPPGLVGEVAEAKLEADGGSGALDQLTLAELIVSGAYDRQVRRARLVYRRRRDALVEALRREAPGIEVSGVAAGLHVVVHLREGQTEDEVVAGAAALGLAVQGLRRFAGPDGALPSALVVGYGTPPGHAFAGAVARLCQALAS